MAPSEKKLFMNNVLPRLFLMSVIKKSLCVTLSVDTIKGVNRAILYPAISIKNQAPDKASVVFNKGDWRRGR